MSQCSFLWRIRKTALESHNSKQMMVYEQITFFIKIRIFSICFLTSKSIFLIQNAQKPGKNWGGNFTEDS